MEISKLINDIILEWSYRIQNGMPDIKNKEHIHILSEVLLEMGLYDIKNELIQNIINEETQFSNPVLNKSISYKNSNGDNVTGLVGNLLRLPQDHSGRQAAERLLPPEGSEERKLITKELSSNSDSDSDDTSTDKNKDTDVEKKPVSNIFTNDPAMRAILDKEKKILTKLSKKHTYSKQNDLNNNDVNDTIKSSDVSDELPKSDYDSDVSKSNSTKKTDILSKKSNELNRKIKFKIPSASLKSERERRLQTARNIIDEGSFNKNTKRAFDIFEKSFTKLLNAENKKQQIAAINKLNKYGFIEKSFNGKKLYISNLPISYKHFTTDNDGLSVYINKLAEDVGIDIPIRDTYKDRFLADISGKHNEYGVVAMIYPTQKNLSKYNTIRKEYSKYAGDDNQIDSHNKDAANYIKNTIQSIYPNSKINKAIHVGGLGSTELEKMGISPKKDPTDILIDVKTEDGGIVRMKFSMKIYTNPNDITMKNAGLGDAGSYYLGYDDIDRKLKSIKDVNNWAEDGISDDEQNNRKRRFKEEYLSVFSEKMNELTQNNEGQQKLLEMWKDVHGCGNNVYTVITNKKNGNTKIHNPDYYCNPKLPFTVEYDGIKLLINMSGSDDKYIQMELKTESNGSSKLLFKHKSK
jgi:hypothetical protein